MENFNLNQALFVGIDSHPSEHTALMIDRFEEEQGRYQFENTKEGIFTITHTITHTGYDIARHIGN